MCQREDVYSLVEVALPGGHEGWKVAAATAGAVLCLYQCSLERCLPQQLVGALTAAAFVQLACR
jgi:hypothetical protein